MGRILDHIVHLSGQLISIGLAAFCVQLLAYMVVTSAVINAYRFFWNKGLCKYKIQKREASRADIRREVRGSLSTMAIFSLIYAGVHLGAAAGFFTVYTGAQPFGIPYLLASTVAIVVAHDAYFYWTHRLMHHRRLFFRFHRTHHKSVTPTAYACYAFDVPEAILHGLFLPIWLLLVPMQLPGLLFLLALMFTRTALGHSGVEVFPPSGRWFGWVVTNTDHDIHHSAFHYNFGLYFSWWDRLMGTGYPANRHQVGGSPAPRRTIDDQSIPLAEINF
jgi:lathosterol oxidase